MRTTIFFTVLILVVCGCNSSNDEVGRSGPASGESILDQLLSENETAKRIAIAERDRPGDEWSTNPAPRNSINNVSRDFREAVVATEILKEAMVTIRTLPPEGLLQALKTYDIGSTNTFRGVAYRVYRDANAAIIKELHLRNDGDLSTLRKHIRDRREVFTGDSGPPCTIGDVVESQLKKRP